MEDKLTINFDDDFNSAKVQERLKEKLFKSEPIKIKNEFDTMGLVSKLMENKRRLNTILISALIFTIIGILATTYFTISTASHFLKPYYNYPIPLWLALTVMIIILKIKLLIIIFKFTAGFTNKILKDAGQLLKGYYIKLKEYLNKKITEIKQKITHKTQLENETNN